MHHRLRSSPACPCHPCARSDHRRPRRAPTHPHPHPYRLRPPSSASPCSSLARCPRTMDRKAVSVDALRVSAAFDSRPRCARNNHPCVGVIRSGGLVGSLELDLADAAWHTEEKHISAAPSLKLAVRRPGLPAYGRLRPAGRPSPHISIRTGLGRSLCPLDAAPSSDPRPCRFAGPAGPAAVLSQSPVYACELACTREFKPPARANLPHTPTRPGTPCPVRHGAIIPLPSLRARSQTLSNVLHPKRDMDTEQGLTRGSSTALRLRSAPRAATQAPPRQRVAR